MDAAVTGTAGAQVGGYQLAVLQAAEESERSQLLDLVGRLSGQGDKAARGGADA